PAQAAITLGLAHPAAQRFGRTAHLAGDRGNRCPLRSVIALVLQHHPHRALAQRRGVTCCCRLHGSLLSKVGASGEPGGGSALSLAFQRASPSGTRCSALAHDCPFSLACPVGSQAFPRSGLTQRSLFVVVSCWWQRC